MTVDEDEITDVVDTMLDDEPEEAGAVAASPSASGDTGTPSAAALSVTGRPLVLWSGDPRDRGALVLARFPAAELDTALSISTLWSKRYDELALGEAGGASGPLKVLLLWRRGVRQAVA